jgi:N-methylhydantoinase A
MMLTIGIDVGGTFTDLVAIDRAGRTTFAKALSTSADQSVGVMAGLNELARRLGMTRAAMLAATHRLIHGTTVATNALLERKGAKVALLTTEGHRDVIEMREGLKGNRYDLRSPPPEPLVPRELRFGIHERLRPNGEVLTPLDHVSLDRAIETVRNSGVTSVAVWLSACISQSCARNCRGRAYRARVARTLRLAIERRAAPDQGIRARLDNRRERLCRADGSAVFE